MFCSNCGAKNVDGAAFCKECGTQLSSGQPNYYAQPAPVRSSGSDFLATVKSKVTSFFQGPDRNKNIGIVAVAAVAIVALILVFSLFGRGYKATIDKYFDATFDADPEAIFELVPDEVVEAMLDEAGYKKNELDDFIDDMELQDSLEYTIEYLDDYLGDDWKVDYEITDTEKLSSKEIRDLKEEYEDEADIELNISDAMVAEIEITVTGEDDDYDTSMDIYLIKVGSSWYLDFMSMGSSMFY